MEKLAGLLSAQGKTPPAIQAYEKALQLEPTPQQKIRLFLILAQLNAAFGNDLQAYATYRNLLRENPTYPDRLTLYQTLLALAQKLGKTAEAEQLQKSIDILSPKPPATGQK